jgi:hypothetical protein
MSLRFTLLEFLLDFLEFSWIEYLLRGFREVPQKDLEGIFDFDHFALCISLVLLDFGLEPT